MIRLLRKPAAIAIVGGLVAVLTISGVAVASLGLNPFEGKDLIQAKAIVRSLAADSAPALESAIAQQATESGIKSDSTKVQNSSISGPAVGPETASAPQVYDTITKTESGNSIDFTNRKLCNNQWGAPASEKLTSGVYYTQNKSFGWYWNRNTPLEKAGVNGVLPIYPSIRVGGSPWDISNSVDFPVKVGKIKSLTLNLSYKYDTVPDGAYDFAYDMFLTDSSQPSSSPRRNAEVMIWIHRTLAAPSSSYKGDFSDGFNNYELYSYQMSDGRLYFAFIMKGAPVYEAQHTVDAKKLLDQINLNPDWYIPGIELGNEVVYGTGKVEISQFEVNLNGHGS
jgi:hypothetical protein